MKLVYLSSIDAQKSGKYGPHVRAKVFQERGESFSLLYPVKGESRNRAKLQLAVHILEEEKEKEASDITLFLDSRSLVFDWGLVQDNDWSGVRNQNEWKEFLAATKKFRIMPRVRDKGVLSGTLRDELKECVERRNINK